MENNKIQITKKGFDKLIEQISHLADVERPAVIKAVSDARALGDLSENAEYKASREKQRIIESKLSELQKLHSMSEIIDLSNIVNKETIRFGARVKFLKCDTDEEKEVQIVSEYESDPTNGLISIKTPVAKAILGKKIGDVARLRLGENETELEILEISYSN
ncbi:transcription elongation factor GreA [Candidatus Deianiraea vastatrix]|uniref:Transcription elongation factor GreA n=1 Tax=Candidatus Deianiraea vastatrix TaxID=2163644 RepID=A0A5B8XGX9_9RICK|nr:transcription elongation factor GreA [Candidatus Deianiraea vastatrix]QED23137.1 Transcription elongation factor GreA [Candidatus Deianiraea vastatrix]